MNNLLAELRNLTINTQRRPGNQASIPFQGEKHVLPMSPLLDRTNVKYRRLAPAKLKATFRELGPLKDNPWAEILASPVRMDRVIQARLPRDLLVDLEYVRNPSDGKIHLMPAKLADLEALEGRIERELKNEDWIRARDLRWAARDQKAAKPVLKVQAGMTAANFDAPEACQPPSDRPIHPRHPQHAPARLFANINYLRLLTFELTQENSSDPKLRKTKPTAVTRLLPFQHKQAVEMARHYERNKVEVELATGAIEYPPPKDRYLQPEALQWQGDMYERVATIVRKRLLASLWALGAAFREDARNPTKGRVIPIPIPRGGKAGVDDMTRVASSSAADDGPGEKTGQGAMPPSMQPTQTPERREKSLVHPNYIPGSIFLHFGDGDILSLLESSSEFAPTVAVASSTLPPLPSDNPLIPPMLNINDTFRFPIFPLWAMLETDDDVTELKKIVGYYPIFQLQQQCPASPQPLTPTESVSQSRLTPSEETGSSQNYLVLLTPRVGPANSVIRETWRLWNYLGGKKLGALPGEVGAKLGSSIKNARELGPGWEAMNQEDENEAADERGGLSR